MKGEKHNPTSETRAQVSALSAYGVRDEDVATYLHISKPTLYKYYHEELKSGRITANAKIAETLYNIALSGNPSACMFWLKTRAGWREVQKMELAGEVKNELNVNTTLADLMIENFNANKRNKE